MELLIGAGNKRERQFGFKGTSGWKKLVTLDMSASCKPDVVYDLEGCQLPFKDSTFDELHAYEVLEHTGRQGDWKFFFRQFDDFARVLKPHGMLFITSPGYQSKWLWGDPGHTRYIGPEVMTFLCKKAYDQIGLTSMTDYRPYFKHFWDMVYRHETEDHGNLIALVSLKGE